MAMESPMPTKDMHVIAMATERLWRELECVSTEIGNRYLYFVCNEIAKYSFYTNLLKAR